MACLSSSYTLQHAVSSAALTKAATVRAPRRAVSHVAVKPVCSLKDQKNAAAAAAAGSTAAVSFLFAPSAHALETEKILSALDQAESFSKQAVDAASQALDAAKELTNSVIDAATPVVEAATPVVVKASKSAADAVAPAATELAGQAEKALASSGVELAPVISAAKTAVVVAGDVLEKTGDVLQAASPYAQSALETILAQEPTVLAAGAGGLVLFYLIVPSLFSGIAYSARGYAGEFSAAQALDLLSKEDYTLVDVRTDSQKAKSGVPALPKNSKKKLVAVPVEELPGKLRSQIRNARKVEAEITALKISSLKRLGKGSKIIIIDTNGDSSKIVAQSLAALGLKKTWVVKDGVDGGQGWISSQLATEAAGSYSLAEVLLPSRVISKPAGTVQVPRSKFLLSSGSSE